MALDREEAANLLNDLHSILVVVRGEWQKQSAWSDWDQSVYERLLSAQASYLQHAGEGEAEPVGWLPNDYTELAQMVEAFHAGSVAFANEPEHFHHLIEFTPPLLRDFIASLASAAPHTPVAAGEGEAEPVGWETPAEWEMEQAVFAAANRDDVPQDVRRTVAKLWEQYCLLAAPHPHQVPEGWQPIETAPKDGTYILAYQTGVLEPSQTVVAFDESWGDGGWWMCCDGKNPELPLRGQEPTHWRPLPASPASADQGGE